MESRRFFRDYWAPCDQGEARWADRLRLRVNDTELSLHPTFGHRFEASANGLALFPVDIDLFAAEGAELVLELWGGHPATERKRFTVNGRTLYYLPEDGTAFGVCSYTHPHITLRHGDLVRGVNAVQFACDRGRGSWGHFIVDDACIRVFVRPDTAYVGETLARRLEKVTPAIDRAGHDCFEISLSAADGIADEIESVEYYAWYLDADLSGNHALIASPGPIWHGFTYKRAPAGHVGTATRPPFSAAWSFSSIPDQPEPPRVCAVIVLRNGTRYVTDAQTVLFKADHLTSTKLYRIVEPPAPFWSRAGKICTAYLHVQSDDTSRNIPIVAARLKTRAWDGGAGSIEQPFTFNDRPYPIVGGSADHDVKITDNEIRAVDVLDGANRITLVSDTEHHGIEVFHPGPILALTRRRQ